MGGIRGLGSGEGGVWPRSRPRCAVSGAEHALSAGERSGLSGGSPGSCAPAVSSIVTPLPSIIIITGLLLLGGPPPQPNTTARIQAPLPSLPSHNSSAVAATPPPSNRQHARAPPGHLKESKPKKGRQKEEKKIRSTGPACLLRQCGAAGAHRGTGELACTRVGTCTRLQRSEPLLRGWRHAVAPRFLLCRSKGKSRGPVWGTCRLGLLRAPLTRLGTDPVRPPTLTFARDGERKTRGKGRGDGVCVGEVGTLLDRCREHRSAGCPAPQHPGWGEEPPAHPRDKGASCSALAKSLQRCKGLYPGLAARGARAASSQPLGAGVQCCRPPALTSG